MTLQEYHSYCTFTTNLRCHTPCNVTQNKSGVINTECNGAHAFTSLGMLYISLNTSHCLTQWWDHPLCASSASPPGQFLMVRVVVLCVFTSFILTSRGTESEMTWPAVCFYREATGLSHKGNMSEVWAVRPILCHCICRVIQPNPNHTAHSEPYRAVMQHYMLPLHDTFEHCP